MYCTALCKQEAQTESSPLGLWIVSYHKDKWTIP